MGVLVVASFSISRILYLLDVYCTRREVGCQVKFLVKREAGSGTRDEGRWTKEAAEEKEEIHIMKPSFCAESP
jgi:hypothetical protein